MRTAIGRRVYSVLLLAYPREFRQEYGPQMVQLLRDCERDAQTPLALIELWKRTLLDLVRTLPVEHLHDLRKDNHAMNKLRSDLTAIAGCVLLIIIAFTLLTYGRSHQVSAIITFGYVLDAIVSVGIIGNLIVFVLAKLTSIPQVKIALWTFLGVTVLSTVGIIALVGRIDPKFSSSSVLVGYVVSFVFWYGLHWVWSHKLRPSPLT